MECMESFFWKPLHCSLHLLTKQYSPKMKLVEDLVTSLISCDNVRYLTHYVLWNKTFAGVKCRLWFTQDQEFTNGRFWKIFRKWLFSHFHSIDFFKYAIFCSMSKSLSCSCTEIRSIDQKTKLDTLDKSCCKFSYLLPTVYSFQSLSSNSYIFLKGILGSGFVISIFKDAW